MKRLVLVIGMHRSGTSLVASLLDRCGLDGGVHEMLAQADNPSGFFENQRIVDLNDALLDRLHLRWDAIFNPSHIGSQQDIEFKSEARTILKEEFAGSDLVYLKDPRMCVLLPIWQSELQVRFKEIKVVFVKRNPMAVVRSIQKRNGMSFARASLLWAMHIAWGEVNTRAFNRIMIDYDALVLKTESEIPPLADFLDTEIPAELLSDILAIPSKTLRHHRSRARFLEEAISPGVRAVVEALEIGIDDADSFDKARDLLASELEFYGELDLATHLSGTLHLQKVAKESFEAELKTLSDEVERRGAWGTELSEQVSALEGEKAQLSSERDDLAAEVERRGAWGTELSEQVSALEAANLRMSELFMDSVKVGEVVLSKSKNIARLKKAVEKYAKLALGPDNARGVFRFVAQHASKNSGFSTLGDSIPPNFLHSFDEEDYLRANSDVNAAVISREFESGLEHFLIHGVDEVRGGVRNLGVAIPFFNEQEYLKRNKDVSEAVVRGEFEDGFQHFLTIGYTELLTGQRVWWDTDLSVESFTEKDLIIIEAEDFETNAPAVEPFPEYENPRVSIIVPAFNNASLTLACLKAIKLNTLRTTYEVILIDDCSSQLAARSIGNRIDGLVFIQNEENLGFLKSCNKAASVARGEFIVLLNNDTNVQSNWLTPMLTAFHRDSKVGMTGSKLIYPDGKLQEAGGIVWDDGSCWNYGRLSDPDLPEFNYLRNVDYVSGASIMLRAGLWRELGGFDEKFSPAYYEDTDLAFRVREAGYSVVYVPQSRVVHFEGQTNGTDESSGVKSYQVLNAHKFLERWSRVLAKEHFPNAECVFKARDRSRGQLRVLYIDHYIPHPDKDAGSLATYKYLKLLVALGVRVHFIGDNFWHYPGENYLSLLQDLGIEVLVGESYKNGWEDWLKKNGEYIDYAFVSRPHIAPSYVGPLREHSQCKIIYMAHDLVHLRAERARDIQEDFQITNATVEAQKQSELELMRSVDYTALFSRYEADLVRTLDPSISAFDIPLYVYELDSRETHYSHSEMRDSVLFVGGFAHAPNVDAVLWLVKEVWPKVASEINLQLRIVGSNAPDEVKALHDPERGVEVLGYISNLALEEEFARASFSVAPLRFGAGIKGKIVTSLYHGVPVLTTPVGAEGIGGVEAGVVAVEPESTLFAKELVELAKDESKRRALSDAALNTIGSQFSEAAAKTALKHLIPEIG